MRETFRATDIGARVGGDEFALLAPNTAAEAAATLAERIRTRATAADSPLTPLAASVSLGVATFDPGQDLQVDATALMRAADEALYAAKRGGGNRVSAAPVARTA
jgi:two-component system cell cycle response regulator